MNESALAVLIVVGAAWAIFDIGRRYGRWQLGREVDRALEMSDRILGRKRCPKCGGHGTTLNIGEASATPETKP